MILTGGVRQVDFPHSFFEDEIRCDFYIPSMVKRTWAAQMEVLSDVDSACQKSGLSYFAEWGTLLGTVRHGGFIPWDDDMDICMLRPDYDRITRDVHAYLPDNYSVVNYRSSRDFKQMLSRIVSSDHYRFDPEYMKKYSGLPFAMGLDIFPLDFLTDDDEFEEKRKMRAKLVYEAVHELAYFDTPVKKLEKRLCAIESVMHTRIDRKGDVLTTLRSILEKIFSEVDRKDARYVALYPLWLDNSAKKYPIEWYENSIRLPFETMSISVPAGYDRILVKKYGSSYMQQIRSGGAHEYPCYELHMNVLKESFGYEWPSYSFNASDISDGKKEYEKEKGTAVFVTYSPRAFENMRDHAANLADDGYDVVIHPVKKYEIAPDMSSVSESTEKAADDFYTGGIKGARVEYDPAILSTRPAKIVTDYPYDEYNLIIAVDKIYYSKALKSCTDMLVYIPPYEASCIEDGDERSKKLMPSYVCQPVLAACDRIVVKSNNMRDRYIDCLCAFSGEGYRDVWERKVACYDKKAAMEAGSHPGRKKVMFYVGISSFADCGTHTVEKIRDTFRIFADNSDKVDVIYKTQEGFIDNLKRLYPKVYDDYAAGMFPDGETMPETDGIDAYYGEPSVYATKLINDKKPVMIWNTDI